MAKLVIDNTQLANAFFEDAHLLGIQCPAEPYRFVWMINRVFGLHFQYLSDGEIKLREQGRNYEYAVYFFAEQHMELEHYLYVNNDDGKHLLPELKHIDYLWLMKGARAGQDFINDLMNEIRKLEQVLLVLELTNEKIRNKEHLVV